MIKHYWLLWLVGWGLLGSPPVAGQARPPALDSLVAVAARRPFGPAQVQALSALGETLRATDSARARRYAQQALAGAHRLRLDTLTARAWYARGLVAQAQQQVPAALACLRRALRLYQQTGHPNHIGRVYRALGFTYQHANDCRRAIAAYDSAISLFARAPRGAPGPNPLLIDVYNRLGVAYDRCNQPTQSLQTYLGGLRLAERTGNNLYAGRFAENIGCLLASQHSYVQARRYFERALPRYAGVGRNTAELASVHINLGTVCAQLRNDSAALRHLTQGQALNKQLGPAANPILVATALHNLGNLAARQEAYDAALDHYRQCLVLFEQQNQLPEQASTWAAMADCYLKTDRHGLALVYGRRALSIAQQLGQPAALAEAYGTLADVYLVRGRYGKAADYRQRQQAQQDSVLSEERIRQVAELELSFQTRQKEAEIKLLRRNRALEEQLRNGLVAGLLAVSGLGLVALRRAHLQRRANRQLQLQDQEIAAKNARLLHTQERLHTSLREKEMLIKEVHHRVKNNLQIVSSLLALQAMERQPSPQQQQLLQEGQNWIRAMALVHELLYRSEDLTRVDFQRFGEQVVAALVQAYAQQKQPIRYDVQAHGVQLNSTTAVPLGLILNELVSNALKHAFPQQRSGFIRVRLAALDAPDTFTLLVADDGVGLPVGFEVATATSLGLGLVTDLVRQLGGTLLVENAAPGTRFLITFQESTESTLPA